MPARPHTNDWISHLSRELDSTSDRGVALVIGAILDEELTRLIDLRLVGGGIAKDNVAERISLYHKVTLAYRIGIISERLKQDLELIVRIRNVFAHRLDGASFDDEAVCARVEEFAPFAKTPASGQVKGNWIRNAFVTKSVRLIGYLETISEQPDYHLPPCPIESLYDSD